MKYTLDMSSADPADWKLLRYGEPAGTATARPGSFDNAHLEFWQRIETLEAERDVALEAAGIAEANSRGHFDRAEAFKIERDRLDEQLLDLVN